MTNGDFEGASFFSEIWQGMTKFLVLFAIMLGAALKLGVDLIRKRKMTIAQRIGVYIVTVSFGILGWWLCLLMGYNDLRMPLIITSMSYFGEHIIDWATRNKDKIFALFFKVDKK